VIRACFVGISYALHDFLSTYILVAGYEDSAVRHEHSVPKKESGCTGSLTHLSTQHVDTESEVSIVVDKFFLVVKRYELYASSCRMLYVEEVAHEIQRTVYGIYTETKFDLLLICVGGLAVRFLDQN
jgi:hypothetical protein